MWSDDIHKKIIEGEEANQSNQADKAWNGMEALLDKHLPQEKKRRRIIFILFPLLLGSGLAIFYFVGTNPRGRSLTANKPLPGQSTPAKKATTATGESTNSTNRDPGPGATANTPPQPKPAQAEKQTPMETNIHSETNSDPQILHNQPLAEKIENNNNLLTRRQSNPDKSRATSRYKKPRSTTKNQLKNTIITEEQRKESQVVSGEPLAKPEKLPTANETIAPSKDEVRDKEELQVADNKKQADTTSEKTAKTPDRAKKPGSFANRFSLTASFGPDISAVGFSNPGTVQFQYGIGAAYELTKNLVVRTGFYAGSKRYEADSSDYRMPYPINKLEKVEADCFIYEIPVSLVYNFNKVKNHNWFVSAGISSYIMKEETYGYYYKNNWNQPQYYDRTYKNENTHLFSVIGLSGGYRYHLSDRLSFLAEPYIKVPVSGIGVGKVKLNNTGILFTVGFRPFRKNK